MEKKRNKDPCAGCVWRLWIGNSEKVLCSLPVCRRAEYDRVTSRKPGKNHERKTTGT